MSVIEDIISGEETHLCFYPVTAYVEEAILLVWTANNSTVQDIRLLLGIGIKGGDVIPATRSGRMRI